MLTKVILEGAMGKEFGREWELDVQTPRDALNIINANKPHLFHWMRDNLDEYSSYSVICTRADDTESELEEGELKMNLEVKQIRFVPLIAGAGGNGKAILGIAMIAAAIWLGPAAMGGTGLMGGGTALQVGMMGASLLMSGVANALSPIANSPQTTSHYFNGPVNTVGQGAPVQLIYGRTMVGSNCISAALTVAQVVIPNSSVASGGFVTALGVGLVAASLIRPGA
jgi:predicted phage tail protein